MTISKVFAYQIYDSRGYPTVACEVEIDQVYKGLAFVPSGASTGTKEAHELRDNIASDWMGKGVKTAIQNVNEILAPALIGQDPFNQTKIDQLLLDLDGTEFKTCLGANATLAVSLAVCRAAANASHLEVYKYIREKLWQQDDETYFGVLPLVNVFNGGQHANNNIDFQEFMFVPLQPKSWQETLKIVSECFLHLQSILKKNGQSIAKGDEGGFSIDLPNVESVFDLLMQAIETAGYQPGKDVGIGLDIAASEFYENGLYHINQNGQKLALTTQQLLDFYQELIKKYPIVSIEDPFDENDWDGFAKLTKLVNNDIQIVGDDLYCTNPKLLQKGINLKATNAILIKLNQIGTLSEALTTIKLAKQNGLNTIVSHRSGETEDSFIADLAIAVNAKQIKTGSMSRSERLSKYNRIIYIDHQLGNGLIMPSWKELIK